MDESNILPHDRQRRCVSSAFMATGYHGTMQLRIARLCLDCEEIHDQQTCPICSSESFVYISRWIPAPERRARPRAVESPETVNTYRRLLEPEDVTAEAVRWMKRGVIGLAAVGIAGWFWRAKSANGDSTQPKPKPADGSDRSADPTAQQF
jgi:hypothetical protein